MLAFNVGCGSHSACINRLACVTRLFVLLLTAQLAACFEGQLSQTSPQNLSGAAEDVTLLQVYEQVYKRGGNNSRKIVKNGTGAWQTTVKRTAEAEPIAGTALIEWLSSISPFSPNKVPTVQDHLRATFPVDLVAFSFERAHPHFQFHFGAVLMGVLVVIAVVACVHDLRSSSSASVDRRSYDETKGTARRPLQANGSKLSMPRTSVLSQPASRMSLGASETIPRTERNDRFSIAVPSLLEAPIDELQSTDFRILDLVGNMLLAVTVMVPPKEVTSMSQETPLEYVTVSSKDGEDELAMCALAPQSSGAWRCDVYQRGDQRFGTIVCDQHTSTRESFSLIDARKERFLSIVMESDHGQRRTRIFGRNGGQCAEIKPGVLRFGANDQYYQLDCIPDADTGIIVITLLAVDRLRTHRVRIKPNR